MTEELAVLERHGRVGEIHMDRAQPVGPGLVRALARLVAECENDPGIGAILLAGTEKSFATGPDAAEMQALDAGPDAAREEWAELWHVLATHNKPMIGAVSGYAMGAGCSLVLLCDIVIASETARFGQPDLSMGMLPVAGTLTRLVRIVGRVKAMDMVLTGRVMTADAAELAGLVSRIVPVTDLMAEAQELAGRVSSMSMPLALMAKELIDKASEPAGTDVERQERLFSKQSRTLEDHREGLQAVLENRQPAFQHK